ncbi:MAG: hypothetical protein APF76_15010 [Desulfitibacter sp. BRH_c19]|nr:MAG: hypothetical protein APF76_15010 [Desulfitibacter sp. BRH_c19]
MWTTELKGYGDLYRYADDVCLVCRTEHQAERALEEVEKLMCRLKLTLHPKKTKIVDLNQEGFDFLGYHFCKMKSKNSGKIVPYAWPNNKAMKKIREAIREQTSRKNLPKNIKDVTDILNPIIRGWRNYFCMGNAIKKLQALDRYVRLKLLRMAYKKRKWKEKTKIKELFEKWVSTNKLEYFYQRGICGT